MFCSLAFRAAPMLVLAPGRADPGSPGGHPALRNRYHRAVARLVRHGNGEARCNNTALHSFSKAGARLQK
ncbi:MAG TPA: hypothetical protein DCG57_13360 [Candidatus Riflebacteria bacterium]|jgi:hypothetical protein|nr:hypothetical protein [Candidatus Riflebacteria bacterium]